ncbi:hypothetical protein ABN034_33400 [Actinopolymorpha sp. B11F2]
MRWDCAATDNDTARALLEEFYNLPEAVHTTSIDGFRKRYANHGLEMRT